MDLPLCECGCGERVTKPGNRFVHVHWTRTDAGRDVLRQASLGRKQTQETIDRRRATRKGYRHSEETKGKIGKGNLGKKPTKEARQHMSDAHKGKMTGESHWRWKDRPVLVHCDYCAKPIYRHLYRIRAYRHQYCSRECRNQGMSRTLGGSNSYLWQGGKSFEPYSPEFNNALKLMIRERDGFACRLCGIPENGQAHHCHHIDYIKTNNGPSNFATLCLSCHSKTNVNRAFWTNLFQARVKMGLT